MVHLNDAPGHQVMGKTTSDHLLTAFCYISGGRSVTSAINSFFGSCQTKKYEDIYLTTTEKHPVFWEHFLEPQTNTTWIQLRDPGACAEVENVMKLQQWIIQYQLLWVMRLQANPVSGRLMFEKNCSQILHGMLQAFFGLNVIYLYTKVEIWFERPRKRQ